LNAPIYNAVKNYNKSKPVSFHIPGHKMGYGLPGRISKSLATLDITEIPGLDNLHYPQSIVKEAQILAEKAFEAEKTYFLVNGASSGIHAAIMTICNDGDKIIVARDCHRAVIGGLILAGAEPVYICPHIDKKFCISAGIEVEALERTLRENPDVKGVIITRPNYYGVCQDIYKIAEIVHSYGKILMVDEAHGAHLGFSKMLPERALRQGADISVQSAHKTLPVLTQGAYLHVISERLDIERLEFNLRLLQTTSPSYVIMSLLDAARDIMQQKGAVLLKKLIKEIKNFKGNIKLCNSMKILEEGDIENVRIDITRMVVDVSVTDLTGFETEKYLRGKYGIQVEMSDLYNIVCACSIGNRASDFRKLYKALSGMEKLQTKKREDKDSKKDSLIKSCIGYTAVPEKAIVLKDALSLKWKYISLLEATGKICLDVVTPYPPGIPLIYPGEIISSDLIKYIYDIIEKGGTVNGIKENFQIKIAREL